MRCCNAPVVAARMEVQVSVLLGTDVWVSAGACVLSQPQVCAHAITRLTTQSRAQERDCVRADKALAGALCLSDDVVDAWEERSTAFRDSRCVRSGRRPRTAGRPCRAKRSGLASCGAAGPAG